MFMLSKDPDPGGPKVPDLNTHCSERYSGPWWHPAPILYVAGEGTVHKAVHQRGYRQLHLVRGAEGAGRGPHAVPGQGPTLTHAHQQTPAGQRGPTGYPSFYYIIDTSYCCARIITKVFDKFF